MGLKAGLRAGSPFLYRCGFLHGSNFYVETASKCTPTVGFRFPLVETKKSISKP